MKFLIDENVDPKVSVLLRDKGIDAVSIHELNMIGTSDREILEFAASEDRCVVTRNRDDFRVLTERFFNENRKHTGVLIIPHSIPAKRIEIIAKAIMEYAHQHPESSYNYLFDFIESKSTKKEHIWRRKR